MKYNIKFPANLRTDADAVVSQWMKQNGDSVKNGQPICQVFCREQIYEIALNEDYFDLQILKNAGSIFKMSEALATVTDKNNGEKIQNLNERKNMASNDKAVGNVIPILMPQAGQSMEEGTIVAWKVKPGDKIEVGQVILEIETD
ncbi:MAG: biotin/lipoyl-containing protein [Phycisphaerales bacterium]